MSGRSDELLAVLLARRGITLGTDQSIRPRPRGPELPLSPAQQRIWFLDQLAVGDSAYLMSGAYRLAGVPDVAALTEALRRLVRRHEPLRTAFVDRDGRPVQVIRDADDPQVAVPLPVLDLEALPASARERALLRLARYELGRRFDLGRPPLVRGTLVRLAEDDHLLLLAFHHIVCDDVSIGVLFDELTATYSALVERREPAPAPLPVQFADYVRWLAERDPEVSRGQESYWRDQLAGAPTLLELPTDRPRPAAADAPGGRYEFALPAELTGAVERLRQDADCTLFMVLLAAFTVVLAGQSGQSDVVVGVPAANRSLPELETMVGMFVNTLALRTDLSGDPTLRQVLDRVRRTCFGGLGHREVPLERVIELAAPDRSPGHHPLFQVMFVLNTSGGDDTARSAPMSGLTVRPAGIGTGTARFDLTLVMAERGGRLTGQLDYHSGLFERGTVRRLADQLRQALVAMTSKPWRRLSELTLLTQAERDLLLGGLHWPPADGVGAPARSGDADEIDLPGFVDELVAAQAARTPDAPAVYGDGTVLTYRELDRWADRIARRLQVAGVGPEQPVGLALRAGPAGIAGLLGILRSGGAYLPLDPTHPPERLADLLADSGATVLLTGSAYAGNVPDFAGTVLRVEEAAAEPAEAPVPLVRAANQLAYVIYTSGSTGRPKGVMVGHDTLTRLALSFRDVHGFGPGQRILMIPPLTFDASVGDVFPALVSGAALVVHPEPAALTGPALLDLCVEQRITAVDAPSALWQRWVDDLAGHRLPADLPLTVMMVGGERVPAEKLAAWNRLTGGRVAFYNHYGPTEATVCAIVHRAGRPDGDGTSWRPGDGSPPGDGGSLPIGRPLPHVRAYVLDQGGRLRPVGAPGELYLGGDCLARGYLGRPDLTARAFVPDPFSATPGARLYRTGDLARVRGDGELEFLGRVDRQLKIRGHRVEPAEIENVLGQHPLVGETVVVARDQHLVGYVVPRSGSAAPDPEELRSFLRGRLPDYLVPAVFVALERLPLTAHGKVDQSRLPATVTASARPFVPPTTPTERRLAAIWAEALGRDRVGARDGFFDLGGHSLLAAPLLARINREFGVRLPLRTLFEAPRLDAFATLLDAATPGGDARAAGGAGRRPSARRVDLRAEAVLPDDVCAGPDFRPPADADPAAPAHVLLTGATGFLGAFLLDDLLRHTTAELHCLVRAGSEQAAVSRVERNLRRYGLWRPEYAARIAPVLGDLTQPRLGLGGAEFDALADQLDVIYHNGGAVHFVHPYSRLKPANVDGTVEVLRLAGRGRVSAVHHVSTLGVYLGPVSGSQTVTEADPPSVPDRLWGGYNESKWVADRLVDAARQRGLPVSIHRPARVTGHSGTGAGNTDDYLSWLLKTFTQVGAVPAVAHGEDLAPVDYVAAAIGHLSRRAGTTGRDFHYYNPRTIGYDEIAEVLRERGYPVRLVPYERWHALVVEASGGRAGTALGPFAATLPPTMGPREHPTFDCTGTEAAVAADGIHCPAGDATLLRRYVDFFVRTGFLPEPG
ncbi:amino acid adenylation domain-containing protein/thioester reductase-like protein [Micromonospora pisi]|uniref:Amino acid adenylation domain-containing protein/thioester reductase-like protein n=1 Tax=Micromonospora pisi TaxID=589240 RepID=A0A495JTU0_9ACTN|nr:non-ribosomal peptide synthetase [Micromonospora pisi]RKR92251.1 amino acid adenylation domain-containing protein/thioester reductase-like protein [Micromonospora pisi]